MRIPNLHRVGAVALVVALAAPAAFAGETKTAKKPLEEKENPELIGQRNINKGIIGGGSLEKEAALGAQLAAQVSQQAKFIEDPVITEYVNRVGQNLVLHSDAKVPFTIKVIDSDDVNAFALPGGFFFVNKGVLLAADNEAELAGVMAHEIAHVAARHGVENARKGQLLNLATIPLIFLGGIGGYAAQSAASILVPISYLSFSRGAENEADMLGAQYMWASGYDPRALTDFFKKLDDREKKKPGTLAKVFRTHPLTSDRELKVADLIGRFPGKEEYVVTTSEFDRVKARLIAVTATPERTGTGTSDEPRRPTLKRRSNTDPGGIQTPDPMDPNAQPGNTNPSSTQAPPPDKPVLTRRDSDSDAPKPPTP
jgi:beta-barrel assembly-enhancing protease